MTIALLVELIDFKGWTAGALWEDTKFAARHFNDIDRLAVVGDARWEKGITVFIKPFTKAQVKYFDMKDLPKAGQRYSIGKKIDRLLIALNRSQEFPFITRPAAGSRPHQTGWRSKKGSARWRRKTWRSAWKRCGRSDCRGHCAPPGPVQPPPTRAGGGRQPIFGRGPDGPVHHPSDPHRPPAGAQKLTLAAAAPFQTSFPLPPARPSSQGVVLQAVVFGILRRLSAHSGGGCAFPASSRIRCP